MKKNTSLYLAVGLIVLLAIIILIFGLFFLNDKDPRETFNTFYLRFNQVSTLTLDDPVKVNGVKLGKVEDIYLSGHRVLVRIRLRTDVQIPKNSEVRVQNIGIMGERQIGMILGDTLVYFAPNDTIEGLFDAGIAEALGLAGELFDSTKVLIQTVKMIMDSTVAAPEFQVQFKGLVKNAERLEDRLLVMVNETDPQLKRSLRSLNDATTKVNNLLDSAQAPIQGLLTESQGLMKNADGVIGELDTVTKRLLVLTEKLQSKDNTVGILLNDHELHDELVRTVESADSLFRIILQDGLDINVDFFWGPMIIKSIPVTNKLGVHARPAGMIVNVTGRAKSDVTIVYDGTRANAKSILNVMMLAITPGSNVQFEVSGEDEQDIMVQLEQLFHDNFNEEAN